MWRRVSWAAVATIVFLVLAFTAVMVGEHELGYIAALGAIAFAVLSLKEGT